LTTSGEPDTTPEEEEKLIEQIGKHFNASISALRRWCKSIGFKWKRTSNRQYLIELPEKANEIFEDVYKKPGSVKWINTCLFG